MPDVIDSSTQTVSALSQQDVQTLQQARRSARDWVRQMRFNPEVNKSTVGVQTDRVTPELMLGTSASLLRISRGEEEPSAKDSLAYQRFYGPAEYFAEHIQRDQGKLARGILWKATNKGNLDFIGSNMLEPHISSVFYDSNLAQYLDGTTPFQAVDLTFKTTRVGQGGIASADNAPNEMRTVQPSYYGFVDPVRCYSEDTQILTKQGWISVTDVTETSELATYDEYQLVFKNPTAVHKYELRNVNLYGYVDNDISYLVTGNHRMLVKLPGTQNIWQFRYAQDIHKTCCCVPLQGFTPVKLDPARYYIKPFNKTTVYCPTVDTGIVIVRLNGSKPMVCGNSPQRGQVGLSGYMTKNVLKGSDGKLYQRFINARTGKQELVDSVTAANSVVSSHDVMEKNTRSVFAHGGKTGVRIVNRQDVDYYLPRPDDAYSTGSNMVTMLDGIKQMRLLMGCVHPMTPMITLDHQGMVHITSARNISDNKPVLYSCTPQGQDSFVICDKVLTRLTTGQKYFYKVVMSSGRVLITSPQHKWVTLNKQDKIKLLKATAVKPGMRVPRKLFVRTPVQNTDINGVPVTRDIAVLLGRVQRTMHKTDTGYRIQFLQQQRSDIKSALDKLCAVPSYFTVYKGTPCVHIKDPDLLSWIQSNIGTLRETHKVPACILSADTLLVAQYLDSYSKQVDNVGMDGNGDIWLMDLDNQLLRTAMAFLLSRIGTDTVFRDIKTRKGTLLALKLVPAQPTFGDCVVDTVVAVVKIPAPGYMIDFDADDDVYAVGHGVITHNSKYATQAVPLLQGQVPLVQSIDRYSGKTIESLVGRKLGARFAQKPGVVTAVRQDRIDVVYDDGKKGSIELYKNFPANIKGYLSNRVLVKAGDRFDKDQIIAASNFTDDKGVQAMGRNLRVGYISYKGGTYQDACVLSESAAKKLSSRTMYKTNVDLNSTIRTGKNTYTMWKPQQYKNEALQKLDDDGVVKVGQVLHKGDPMVLAVQVAEPSPGTMGKRLLTDKCQEWEHAHPGVVTDVVKTRKGIKVYATVDAPVQVGDKLSGRYGNKSTCFQGLTQIMTDSGWKHFQDLTPQDKVAQLRPDGYAQFVYPTAYIEKDYDGQLCMYESRRLRWAVTPDHNMACITKHKWQKQKQSAQLQFIQAQLIQGKSMYHRCAAVFQNTGTVKTKTISADFGRNTHNTQAEYTFDIQDWASFLGLFLAQGYVAKRKQGKQQSHQVCITQKRDLTDPASCQRCDKIQALLERMGLPYTRTGIKYVIVRKPLWNELVELGGSYDKFIPEQVFTDWPASAQQKLLQWHYMGDGDKTGTTIRCATVSKQLAYDLQRLYILNGYHCLVSQQNRSGVFCDGSQKPSFYRVTVLPDKFAQSQPTNQGSKQNYYRQRYRGKVYCVQVPTHTILVQLQGKPMWCGNCTLIIPDDQMPRDSKGRPLDMLMSPLGIVSRTNPSQLIETQLGKIAQKLGHPIEVNQFQPQDKIQMVKRLSKLHNVPMSQDVYDPDSGRTLKGILTGRQYVYKLKHMAQSKMSARGTATYNAQGVPAAGGQQGSKRFGGLQSIGLIGHGAFDALVTDAKLIRGQSNAEFWRKIRVGQIPTIPGQPLVHKKFFAHLQGSGMRIRKTSQGISIFALTNSDVKQIAGNRQVKTRDTYQSKSFQPMDGGLFGTDIFGMDGTRWGYIQLDEPMLNPVMQQPVARLLQIPQKKLQAILRGQQQFRGKKGPQAIADALQKIDIENQSKKALAELKAASKSKKDAALKRYVAIQRMRRVGVHPSEFMLQRIPVIPPQFRPITSHNGLTMVADSNYLYAQLIDARDDMRAAQNLPDEYKDKARSMIYTKWKQLVGLYEPQDRKLKQKSVKGLLKWALGEPAKYGAFQRKVFGSIVDTVGRGVVVPNSRLKLNQVGLPQDMAWNVFSPFVTRALVQAGYSTVDALKATKAHSPVAKQYLLKAMQERPVIMNRAPSLHKLSLMGFNPRLVTGHAIHVHPSIVVPFGMDFDGDTVCNQVLIWVQIEKIQKNIQKKSKQHLTQLEKAVYYASIDNQQEANMIAKEQKIQVMGFNCSLADLPVVDGSEVRKSDTVTEWDVVPGVYTHTIDPETGKAAAVEITKVSKHSGLTMYDCKVSVSGAYSNVITASEDHSLITYNPTTMQLEKTKPQDAKGRCVPRARYDDINKPGMCYEYMDIAGQRPMSYKLGMFLGIMLGDGWVDANNATKIACCDESLQKYITEELCTEGALLGMHKTAQLHEYGPDPDRFSQNKRGVISVYLKSNVAEALGDVIGKGAENKRIPPFSLVGSRAHMIGILMGMLATDGSVSYSTGNTARKAATKTIAIHTISPMLRDGIQTLCRKLGIRTHATPYMGANSKSTCYAVTLSLEDFAREASKDKVHYRIPMADKQESMERIIADVSAPAKGSNSYTIVPFPRGLFCEFSYAKIVEIAKDPIISGRAKGFIRRDVALRIADRLEAADWKHYADPTHLKKEDRTGRTPEQAKAAVDAWIALVRDENTDWAVVEDVTPSTCTEGWDCTVPGPYTFALSDGTVVQDTVNIHAPVSRGAVRDIEDKMMPQRNLISMANRTILYKPQKQYIQGLYLATRTKDKPAKRFATLAEARQAYKQGTLDVDDPIQIG